MLNFWYTFMSSLPFEWTSYLFMQNALLTVLIITPMFGLLGTMIVNNKMSFFSDSLGHSALTGMGMPQEEAEYYQSQFEAGHTIVAVNVDDRTQNPQEVRALLNQYGATDINVQPAPYAGNAPAASSATGQERTYNSNVPPATYNAGTQPPAETQDPVTQEGTYNPNVPPAAYNEQPEQPDEMREPGQP